ncbi:MAG: DUF4124 domain-containing protein [Steroidobacteraceae bacterium]
MIKPRSLMLAAALCVALPLSAVHAEIYRWVDDSGRVHYSDRPVEGAELVQGSSLKRRDPEVAAARNAANRGALTETAGQIGGQLQERQTQQTVQADLARTRAEQCKQARERYEKSLQARRIYRTLADGQKQFLSDAEADKVRLQAKADVDSLCAQSRK